MLQSHQYRRLRRLRRLIDDNRVKRTSVAMVSANNLPAILPPLSAPIAFARPCHIFEQQLHTSTSASGAHDVGFRQHAMMPFSVLEKREDGRKYTTVVEYDLSRFQELVL